MANVDSDPSNATFGRAEVNGIRIYYRIAGSGEPVVLLHGFPETSRAWRKVMPALAAHYTVLAPDLRGFGDSDRPDTGYDKRTVAEDVYQLVRQLGLGPINLVSHDVGMMVGYAYASVYPAEVRRLVLIEAALPGLGLEKLYDADKYPRMYHLPLFEAPNGLAEALITGREKMFVRHFMRQQAYNTAALEDDVLDGYADRLAAPGALRAGIAYFRAHRMDAEHNREYASTKLSMPVLTVGGTASFGADLEGEIRPLAKNMRAVMIEGCGHYVPEEQPGRLTDELLRFFREDV
ncbi:putative hydrolase [Acidisarcina polymorpha]|uniref:Putative hydrolase n=1 Tax=Acidisarcina polymorpha TaxID=2211140 RepID=A0A2Z5G0H0_9BACT|nr:alpha/beta hydrolase [Acidisarcina polymorpha]AXC12076.1 putative hydrolase [Acidisarcina polymorpha]